MQRYAIVLISVLAGLLATQAHAHFLFIRILTPADGKRVAEVYFSDRADAGDPEYLDKIAHTQLWRQMAPGKFVPLDVKKGDDRLQAVLEGKDSALVIGVCEYGVLPRKIPFLLRHFPKSMAGTAADLNRMQATDKVPLEIVARAEKDGLHLTVLLNGKPMPNAPINTLAEDLSGENLKADKKGTFYFKAPPRPGYYTVYTSHFHKEAGKRGDKQYAEIRDFATLSFPWPLNR